MHYRYHMLLAILIAVCPAHAAVLQWDIAKDDRIEMVRTAQVTTLVGGRREKNYEERNIVDLTCYGKEGPVQRVRGLFSVYQRDAGSQVFMLQEQYPTDFGIRNSGEFIVAETDYMPNLRHIPSFPGGDVRTGSRWEGRGELVLQNFSEPLRLSFTVEYVLKALERREGTEVARVEYVYVIDKTLLTRKYPGDFPARIIARNEGNFTWDVGRGRPTGMFDKYQIFFIFADAARGAVSYGFRMNITTAVKAYKPVSPEQQEKERAALEKEIPRDSGVAVDQNDRGLVLRLGEVLFDLDSYRLRKDARKTLDALIGILGRKYPDREIIVEGHTDNTGTAEYNMQLSKQRARTVAEYLKKKGGRDKLSYRGLGQDVPIDDNGTKEGRQRNRRVEMIIKLR